METSFATIKIDEIKVTNRKRQADSEKVKELSESIKTIGLVNPISVCKDSDGFRLIAGLHRLTACKLLNWTEIQANIMELDLINSELAEIDENLIRCELHYIDRAEMLKRRQEIYEELYPEAKAEEKRKRKPSNHAEFCADTVSAQKNETESFTADTAKKTGLSDRTIRRDLQLSKNLDSDVKDDIKELDISKQDAICLSRLDKDKQKAVIDRIKESPRKKKVKEAAREIKKEEFSAKAKELNEISAGGELEKADTEPDIDVKFGDIWQAGEHILICADNTNPAVVNYLRDKNISLAFADPPYNAKAADYDMDNFFWNQDYLLDIADTVAVTPGTISIADFFKNTNMHYKWSVACHIKNGKTAGAIGFSNWLYTAIFAKNKSVFRNSQDFAEAVLRPDDHDEESVKRQKPFEYLIWLIELFSKENEYILDAFAGSGSFMIVAEKLQRKSINIEILPDMCSSILKRFKTRYGKGINYIGRLE